MKKAGASETLLDYLRDHGLTGCKRSCGIGECGSCTVVVSHRQGEGGAVVACLVPLASLQGAAVTTVEGLGQELHPVQELLHAGHATQCGFCSPGLVSHHYLISCFHPSSKVMSAVGLLASCPSPDIEDLGRGLQGNLCRCTGYRPILSSLADLCSNTERQADCQKGLMSLNNEAERRRAEADSTELELESTTQVPINVFCINTRLIIKKKIFEGLAPSCFSCSPLCLVGTTSRCSAEVGWHRWTAWQPGANCCWTSGGTERDPRDASG